MMYLLFSVEAQQYAIDFNQVAEVLPEMPLCLVPGSPLWLAGLIRVEDKAIALLDLAGLNQEVAAPSQHLAVVLIKTQADPEQLIAIGISGATALVEKQRLTSMIADGVSEPLLTFCHQQASYQDQSIAILDPHKLALLLSKLAVNG